MVAATLVGPPARLLPRRGQHWPALLDLPRRCDRRWARRASELVHPRAVRMMHISHEGTKKKEATKAACASSCLLFSASCLRVNPFFWASALAGARNDA